VGVLETKPRRKARDNEYTEDGKKWRWIKTSKQNETNKTKTNYM
jgi:hypothetical protein